MNDQAKEQKIDSIISMAGKQKDKIQNQANQSNVNKSFQDFYDKSFDYFEKMLQRLRKKENYKEALVVGLSFIFIGLAFVFAGSEFLNVLFSIFCVICLGTLVNSLLCIIFDIPWDSEMGVALNVASILISMPLVQYAVKLSEMFAVPLFSGLCFFALAQNICTIFLITQQPYYLKTIIEVSAFLVAFFVAIKIQDAVRILVTAFFGSYLTISGGVIVFDKFPEASPKKKTINENIINYLPFIVGLLSLAILGMFVQMKHLKDKQQLELEQQGLDKMKQQRRPLQRKSQEQHNDINKLGVDGLDQSILEDLEKRQSLIQKQIQEINNIKKLQEQKGGMMDGQERQKIIFKDQNTNINQSTSQDSSLNSLIATSNLLKPKIQVEPFQSQNDVDNFLKKF